MKKYELEWEARILFGIYEQLIKNNQEYVNTQMTNFNDLLVTGRDLKSYSTELSIKMKEIMTQLQDMVKNKRTHIPDSEFVELNKLLKTYYTT